MTLFTPDPLAPPAAPCPTCKRPATVRYIPKPHYWCALCATQWEPTGDWGPETSTSIPMATIEVPASWRSDHGHVWDFGFNPPLLVDTDRYVAARITQAPVAETDR